MGVTSFLWFLCISIKWNKHYHNVNETFRNSFSCRILARCYIRVLMFFSPLFVFFSFCSDKSLLLFYWQNIKFIRLILYNSVSTTWINEKEYELVARNKCFAKLLLCCGLWGKLVLYVNEKEKYLSFNLFFHVLKFFFVFVVYF